MPDVSLTEEIVGQARNDEPFVERKLALPKHDFTLDIQYAISCDIVIPLLVSALSLRLCLRATAVRKWHYEP